MAESQSANIGANFSNYQGNAGLGGFGLGAGRIDTGPLMDLAKYAMLYNREEYLQRQKDADDKLLELSKLAAINLNDLKEKDRNELVERYNSLLSYAREYATKPTKNPAEKIKANLEWQLKMKDVKDDYDTGKTRAVGYEAQKEAIQKTYAGEPAIMNDRLASLDKQFNSTSIKTKLSAVPQYEFTAITPPKAVSETFQAIQEGTNKDLKTKFTIFSPKGNPLAADEEVSEFVNLYIPEDSQEFKDLTPEQRDFQKGQNLKAGRSKSWQLMANEFNKALANEANFTDGKFDPVLFENNIKKVPMLFEIFNAMKGLNQYASKKEIEIREKKFSDRLLGFKVPDNLSADDFANLKIDFNGANITPRELAIADQYSQYEKAGGDKIDKALDQTDIGLKQGNLAAEWERIGIAKEQLNKSSNEDLVSATAVLREAADVLAGGQPYQFKSSIGEVENVKRISDPNLLKEFGTIDKDGKTTNVPDDVFYNEAQNKLSVVYYKRDPDDPTKYLTDSKGNNIHDKLPVDFNATQWLGQIVRRKNPNSDIGGVNALIEQFFNSKEVGRKLSNLNKIYGLNVEGSTGSSTTENTSTTTPGSTTKKRVYKGLDAKGDPIFVEE